MNINRAKKAIRKKHKFNIVDVAVLVILAVIFSVAFQLINPFGWIPTDDPTEERVILFTVELREIEKKHSSSVRVNDNVVVLTDGIDIGTVVEVNKAASGKWVIPDSGDIMVLEKDHTKSTVVVTIELKCTYQEGVGYFLHDEQLLVGKSINLKFPMFDTVGECIGIKIKE